MMGGAAAVAKMGVAGALKGPMGKFFGKMGKMGKHGGWRPFSKTTWNSVMQNVTSIAERNKKASEMKAAQMAKPGFSRPGVPGFVPRPGMPGFGPMGKAGKAGPAQDNAKALKQQQKKLQKWRNAAEAMKGGSLAMPDKKLRAEMNKHGYFYNKTLDDFVKDINWHAGELMDSATLHGHIMKVRQTVGFSKTADGLLVLGFLLLLCIACRILNLAAKGTLSLMMKIIGAMISPCRPCLNRCGRRLFGKGYQMVDVYGPDIDKLDQSDGDETEMLPTNRDAEA